MSRSPGLYERIQDFKATRGDLRRRKIVDAVIDILANEGIHALSAFSVGKKTGMRRSHITYYYPNQGEMIEAAVKAVVSTGQELTIEFLSKASTPRACLKAYVAATFEWFKRHPDHIAVMMLLHYYGTVSGEYRKLNTQIRNAGENRIAEILKAGLKQRKSPALLKRTARLIREILVGSLTTFFFSESNPSFDVERRRIETVILNLADELWEV